MRSREEYIAQYFGVSSQPLIEVLDTSEKLLRGLGKVNRRYGELINLGRETWLSDLYVRLAEEKCSWHEIKFRNELKRVREGIRRDTFFSDYLERNKEKIEQYIKMGELRSLMTNQYPDYWLHTFKWMREVYCNQVPPHQAMMLMKCQISSIFSRCKILK